MKNKKDSPARPVRLRVSALIEKQGAIVLVFDPVYRGGCWILPGGGSEFNETITQAVEREVLEETGMTVKAQEICSIREIWEEEKDFPQDQLIRKSLEIIFGCSYVAGEIDIRNNPSIKNDGVPRVQACRWILKKHITNTLDGYPLYPLEFFELYVSGKLLGTALDKFILPPLDLRP